MSSKNKSLDIIYTNLFCLEKNNNYFYQNIAFEIGMNLQVCWRPPFWKSRKSAINIFC